MDNQDKKEFAVLLTSMGEMYNKDVSTDLMRLYFNILISHSIDDVTTGINLHTLDSKHGSFFPKPADIVRNINSNQPSSESMAEMAWAEILGKISSVGSYDNLVMDDGQTIASVRALGGWKVLCSKTTEQLTWMKKEFISIYQNYDSTPLEMLPNELPGRIELEQHKNKQSNFMAELSKRAKLN